MPTNSEFIFQYIFFPQLSFKIYLMIRLIDIIFILFLHISENFEKRLIFSIKKVFSKQNLEQKIIFFMKLPIKLPDAHLKRKYQSIT